MDVKTHWDHIYQAKASTQVSWNQEHPQLSLQFIQRAGARPTDRIMDVGGGASTLVDDLVAAFGFVGGGGIGILEVASHEEVWELVYVYPLYSAFRWEVEPLVDAAHLFGRGIALLEQAGGK